MTLEAALPFIVGLILVTLSMVGVPRKHMGYRAMKRQATLRREVSQVP